MATIKTGLTRLRIIESAIRTNGTWNGTRMDMAAYQLARSNWYAPVITADGPKPYRDLPTAEEEADARRFPYLNRKGSKATYSIPMHIDATSLTTEQRDEWQDRMTALRQFAALSGISINGKDYSKALSVRGKSSNRKDGRGPMYDVTHTSRWDGGRYDAVSAKRAAERLALETDRAIYPWMYDQRNKRRVAQIDATGNVCFGPRGRTVTVAELVSAYKAKQCIVDCETDAMASAIRTAATLRNGSDELRALVNEQKADMLAQRKGKACLTATVAELTA